LAGLAARANVACGLPFRDTAECHSMLRGKQSRRTWPPQFAQCGQFSTGSGGLAGIVRRFVNNPQSEKTLVRQGENEFFCRRRAKSLRHGIRPAKKFHHKVPPEARLRPA
jgi:hypothetical protein